MSVVEVVRALGSWDLNLNERAPQSVVDLILGGRFGHIAIDAARDNPEVLGDELLRTARYVGVLRGVSHGGGKLAMSGSGMAFWLGAEDGLGDVFEAPVSFVDAPFEFVAQNLLPPSGSVTAGTFTAPDDYIPYTQTHRYQTPRQALDYFAELRGCDWRVNGDATLDVGPPAALYAVEPRAAVIRRAVGVDMGLRALPGAASLSSDVEDFSTRVVTLAEGNGTQIQVGTADIAVNPYVDLHGNPVKLTRLVSESNTSRTNADARAALALATYVEPRDQVTVNTSTHDIRGDVEPGDRVWVYDPDAGLVDHGNEITFRGDRISPVLLRVFQVSWPVEPGMGVYFRTPQGVWLDLTDYVEWESGDTTLTVGGYDRPLTNQTEPIGWRPNLQNDADDSVPGVPMWTPPFDQYLTTGAGGLSRGNVQLAWIPPTQNTDGSEFVDGSHHEIRYKRHPFQPAWSDLATVNWQSLAESQWGALGGQTPPDPEWVYTAAPIDTSTYLLQDLEVGTGYAVEIRAVDGANPPNAGDWTPTQLVWVGEDTIPPLPPAAPVVAASLVQVSVRHRLGLASGGEFNLPDDLAYLEVHVGDAETFTPSDTTRAGKIIATRAQIAGQIPVVGTFPVAVPEQVWVRVIAVDQSGNASEPSAAAPVTVQLIDSQWVSDLTADKITAGDFTASYGLVGLFTAGNPTGARFSAGDDGTRRGFMLHRPSGTVALHGNADTGDFVAYRPNGTTPTFRLQASTGNVYLYSDGTNPALTLNAATGTLDLIGTVTTGRTGRRVQVSGAGNEIRFFPQVGETRYARIFSLIPTNYPDDISIEMQAIDSDTSDYRARMYLLPDQAALTVSPQSDSTVYRTRVIADVNEATLQYADSSGKTARNSVRVTADGVYIYADNETIDVRGGGDSRLLLDSDGRVFLGGNNDSWMQITSAGSAQLVSSGSVKSFVLPHPTDADRWLVHGCTESPWAGVEYWGEAEIVRGEAVVPLPRYFEDLTEPDNRQVQVTAIHTGQTVNVLTPPPTRPADTYWAQEAPKLRALPLAPAPVAATIPHGGQFTIKCAGPDGTRVAWLVKAVRKGAPFPVEPLRSEVEVGGTGPYRYIAP